MKQIIRHLRDFRHLLFPEICIHCEKLLQVSDNQFCNSCRDELPLTQFASLENNPIHDLFFGRLPLHWAHSYMFFNKKGLAQSIIHQFKYKDNTQLAYTMGMYHAHQLKEKHELNTLENPILIPVPMHIRKRKKRGYNQAEYYAEGLKRVLNWEYDKGSLQKITHTQSQTKKGRFLRWKNVKEIFHLADNHNFNNRNLVLIDDVLTTGATLEACARELKKASPKSISVITLAWAKG